MKTRLFLILFAVGSISMIAQTKLADKFFDRYGYIKASELYQEAVKDGDSSLHVLTRLGDCYYNNSKSKEALKWYALAADKYEEELPPDYIFKYSQTLKSVGNYEESDKWTAKLLEITSDESRVDDYDESNMDMYMKLQESDDTRIVDVESLAFNSQFSDFGAYVADGRLIFASGRLIDEDDKRYNWNDEPFLDLYGLSVSTKDGETEYGDAEPINSSRINTDYHEANVAITNDGQTMYFTRDNIKGKKRLDYDRKGTSHLKIYKASLVDGQWEDIKELPFNSDKFSTGHPALSPDNKTLYFVSDREFEGAFGRTDIYSVAINDDGSFGEIQNMGNTINTPGREMFPFVSKDSTFYFSSDGHFNLGLLDIFESDILKGSTEGPSNLKEPYNSGYDDFAFFMTDDEHGYFSSNRPGGKGSDDIYSFYSYFCQQTIVGVCRDKRTNEVLGGVLVKLIDETGKVIKEFTTSADGEYEFEVDCNKKYTVVGSKEDYKDDLKEVVTDNENGKVNEADLYLEPLVIEDQIVINPIFFDFDKWNIRTDAQYELENIVDVLRAHPEMRIKIESHTDSRGSDRYNERLSDRRAKSTRDYILSRGIDPSRIESAIGYGEYQLLNECSNGVKCTKEQHQLNRRSYFYILQE